MKTKLNLPNATGLFETHLSVGDMDRSTEFYAEVVGLPLALELRERGATFFWIGKPGQAMLGLWSLGSAPMGLSLHIALAARLEDVLAACDALRARAITPLSFFATETTEPSVIGWMPAAAVYFRDPDGHLIEYLAMLDEPPRPELGIVSWSRWPGSAPEPVTISRHTGPRRELRPLFEEAEDSTPQLDAYLETGEVLVAVAEDRVVGHVQLTESADDSVEIKNMAVDAHYRRRNIGTALIDAATAHTRTQGRSRLTVATASADIGNLRFYQRAGFRVRSVERDAFSAATGYATAAMIDGVPLHDRIWLDLDLDGKA